jgi:hypothetical protein
MSEKLVLDAKLVDSPTSLVACGILHVVVLRKYEVIQIVEGSYPGKEIYVVESCPKYIKLGTEVHLTVTKTVPAWPSPMNTMTVPSELPRYYRT